MNIDSTTFSWLPFVAVLFAAVLFLLLHKRRKTSIEELPVLSSQVTSSVDDTIDRQIVIGENADSPLVTIKALDSIEDYEIANPLSQKNSKSISKLSALFQAIPSLMLENQTVGKQLIEVSINGDLVRASDGIGWRAFSVGSGGIKEHARLLDVQNLQSLINISAIWNIASVLVAQKHLADISSKLDGIKCGIEGVARFQDNQRKARVNSAYEILLQIFTTISDGEFPEDGRIHIGDIERDLLEIEDHLTSEYRQMVDKPDDDIDTFGTKKQTKNLEVKITDLDNKAGEIEICLKTRIAAWQVLMLYPGKHYQKARRQNIEKSIKKFAELAPYSKDRIGSEISSITSVWNKPDTLISRKESLINIFDSTMQKLDEKIQYASLELQRNEQTLLEIDKPTRILLQYENGVFVGAKQR